MRDVIFYEKPPLRQPDLIIGFEGWANAGEASIGVISYLRKRLRVKKFAEIDPTNFYNLSTLRPSTVIKEGSVEELHLPANEFFFFINDKFSHDLVIFQGIEPHIRWKEFVDSILDFSRKIGAGGIYTIGGTYDRVLHTQEPKVSAVVSSLEMKDKLLEYELEVADYQGPSSIHTFLLMNCKERKIPAIGMWGHTPLYLQKSPRVYYALLKRIVKMLEIDLDLEDLKKASEDFEEQIERIINKNSEFRDYIKGLEEEYNGEGRHGKTLEEAEKVIRMEDFLKKGKEGDRN
jgi:proteasome assembly chaperone (PAC2) family protein